MQNCCQLFNQTTRHLIAEVSDCADDIRLTETAKWPSSAIGNYVMSYVSRYDFVSTERNKL
jgi:hypothetical protein